jgi:hypothetical protein
MSHHRRSQERISPFLLPHTFASIFLTLQRRWTLQNATLGFFFDADIVYNVFDARHTY